MHTHYSNINIADEHKQSIIIIVNYLPLPTYVSSVACQLSQRGDNAFLQRGLATFICLTFTDLSGYFYYKATWHNHTCIYNW